MAPNLTITKVDDSSGATLLPGDTIRYTITITNNGDMDATNAILTDVIDTNTILTDGTLDVTPIARNDSYNVNEEAELVIGSGSGVLNNDNDPDGGSNPAVSAVQGSTSNVGNQATTSAGGTVVILSNGSFNYLTPSADFAGTDTFEYTITDDEGDMDTATVSITVDPVNDPPINTVPGAQTTDDATPIDFGTDIQISDVDADPGTVESTISVDFGTLTATTGGGATVTDNGTSTVTITGTVAQVNAALNGLTYDPAGTSGNATITLTTDDQGNTGSGGSMTDIDTIAVSVSASNVAPTVPNVTYNTLGNSLLEVAGADANIGELTSITSTVSLLDAVTDPDSSSLTVVAGTFGTTEGGSVTTFTDGSFFYQPEAGDVNLTDSFTFTVDDGDGNQVVATAFINVGSEVIYVDDDTAAGMGTGSFINPFTTLAEAQALAGTGDVIYVFDGTYNESFVFETDQSLIGQGADFTLSTGELLDGDASTSPVINGTISGTNVGTATVSGVTVNIGSSTALDLDFTAGTADVDVTNSIFNGASVDGILDVDVSGNANVRLDVTDSTFDPGTTDSEGISLNVSGSSQLDFNIIGNTATGNSVDDNPIEVDVTGTATAEGRINNNTLTANNSTGIRIDVGIDSLPPGASPTGIFEINNNFIDVNSIAPNNGVGAIILDIQQGTGDFTIGNNDIDIDPDVPFSGITGEVSLNMGVAEASYNIFNNDVNQVGALGDAYAILQTNPGTSALDGFTTNVLATLNNNGNTVGGATLSAGQVFEQGTHVAGTTDTVDISQPLMVTSLPTEATDVSLSTTDLEYITDAALERWVQTGLSTSQIETLESLTFEITDLPDWHIGAATGNHIQIDTNAFGWGWFIDSTPLEDSEFGTVLSPNYAQANSASPAFGQIDLLTTVLHEMGHALGLPDIQGFGTLDSLMHATLNPSTRRTPTFGLADSVIPNSEENTNYLSSPVALGTLNEDQVVTIEFEVTVNDPLPAGTMTVTNTATVTADGSISENAQVDTMVECFLPGTHILTEKGEIVVEALKIGDKVQTVDGKLEPIKWIGRQTVKPGQIKNPLRGYPVLIKAGALGNNLPYRDLYVSPDHSMFIEGLLINAGALVNDISILQTEPTETFTYYHIELENHALLVAEGAAAESYLPQKENRDEYDNCAEYEELYPHGSNLMLWPMDYPRISSWNKVPRFVSKKLLKIAHQLTERTVEISA